MTNWFFISPFTISVLNVSLLLFFMIYYLAKIKSKTNEPKMLMLFLIGVTIVFLSFIVIFSSVVSGYSTMAWWGLHLIVFATVPMVLFAYQFKGNYFVKESRIAAWITTIVSCLIFPYYIHKTVSISPSFNFEGFLYAFFDTPEIGIVIGLELVWVVVVFFRKAMLISNKDADTDAAKAIVKLAVIFISPIILIVTILLAYANLLAWEVVAHILGTGIMIMLFIFIIVYINNSSGPSTFMIKLIGLSLGFILITFGFSSSVTYHVQNKEFDQRNLQQLEQVKTAITVSNLSTLPENIRYVISRPESDGENSPNHQLIYSRYNNFDYKVINTQNKNKPFKENRNGVRMYRAINPLDSKTYYINYSFSIKDTIYEVGYSYLKFREIIHDTCKILFILILVIAFIVIIVFPYFFNEGLLRPLNTLLTGVKEVNEGKLDTEVPILVRDEIGILSESFNHMVSSMSEAREKLNNAFSQQIALTEAYERFVPKEFLDFLMKESVVNIKLGDHIQKRMTILFSDIRSFTNISEKMTPQENFNFINSYFKKVGPVISKNSGFIDKYIGDSIMALFPKSPQNALNAAIETQDEIKSYNRYAYKENLPPIDAGIGIHTGELMLGTVGEDKRMEGTVISDAVNLAARMEKLSKIYDAKIILSSDTFSSLDDTSNYNYRYLDKVQVKGKDDFVDIYEFFDGDRENIIEDKLATKEKFEEGVSLFQKGEQGLALKLFEQVSLENKKDVAAQLYIERCKSKKVIK